MIISGRGSWTKLKLIGNGGSSKVYEAEVSSNRQSIAVKEIFRDDLSDRQIEDLRKEFNIVKELNHINIIKYLYIFEGPNKLYMCLEYADRGCLRQFYLKKGPLNEGQASNCMRQLLTGLEFIHSKGIAHRDIKAANLLLNSEGTIKLADFGSCKPFDIESSTNELKGTPQWMAPEVIKGLKLTTGWIKADIWSVGCTLVEVLTGKIPYFYYENPMTAMFHIANGKLPIEDYFDLSRRAKAFVLNCCALNPNLRQDVKDLLSMQFVSICSPLLSPPSHNLIYSSVEFNFGSFLDINNQNKENLTDCCNNKISSINKNLSKTFNF
jgi:serine/threonine protein kinase